MKPSPLKVTSEIGRLRSVLLHRPGKEVENLTPDLMARLLFDDIPYLKIAQEEHDAFAKVLRDNGSEVLYLEDLAAEALEDRAVREQFIDEYLAEANIQGDGTRAVLRDFFLSMDVKPMVLQTMAGVRRTELPREELKFMSLADRIDTDNPPGGGPHAQPLLHPGSLRHHRHRNHPQPHEDRDPKPGDPLRQVHLQPSPQVQGMRRPLLV